MNKAVAALALAILCAESLPARHLPESCGTHTATRAEQLFLHQQSVRRSAPAARAASPALPDVGQIAILGAADGVVARRHAFDLQQTTLRFVPVSPDASAYRVETGPASYDASATGAKVAALGDDDTREFALPFEFPYFSSNYRRIFVNSDGNLTFGGGDDSSNSKTSGRMLSGPPRISPFFDDLDPSSSPRGVFVLSEAGRFVVSWVKVPEYSDFGGGPALTLQVRLFPDGRIEFAYDQVQPVNAVVGIAPGSLRGSSSFVAFSAQPASEYAGAVVEVFTGADSLDIFRAAQKFYESHEDAYDYLVFYNGLNIPANTSGAIAYTTVARNDRDGTGDIPADFGDGFGSPRRLQAVLNMGPTSQYPLDPNGRVPARGPTGDTPLTILAHETGHLFLAYASVRDPASPDARPMLGRDLFHWSFNFNSEASFLEGNRIQDNGAGASPRFTTVATVEQYSPLDQYLMGFRAPEEVSPMFLLNNTGIPNSRAPQVGLSFNGLRRDFGIAELIAAEGRRTPDSTVAQRHFRFAFVLVIPNGTAPVGEQVDRVDAYRRLFESFYQKAAGGRATADTALGSMLSLSVFPAGGVPEGGAGTASIAISQPAAAPLAVILRSQGGLAGVPSTVTIPAGASRATFAITGIRAGVDDLTAQPADSSYETVFARIRVAPPGTALELKLVSGAGQAVTPGVAMPQPVQLRVVDANRTPYLGVTVRATVSGGGTVDPPSATTDSRGVATFRWTPGDGPNRLTAALDSGATVTIDAVQRPVISPAGVVNAASFAPQLAPGMLAALFGSGLAGDASNVQVLVGGEEAQVFAVAQGQVNFLIPGDLPSGPADLQVIATEGASNVVQIRLDDTAPGIFFDAATGYGAIQVNGSADTTVTAPAAAGDVIVIYATGLGAVRPSKQYPGLSETAEAVTARIDQSAAEVLFSGLAPGFPGLYQVNAVVPAGVGSGARVLTVTAGGKTSNQVKIGIR